MKVTLQINKKEQDLFMNWCWKHFKILNYARQIRLGSTTLHSDRDGNIKAEFKIWSLDDKK